MTETTFFAITATTYCQFLMRLRACVAFNDDSNRLASLEDEIKSRRGDRMRSLRLFRQRPYGVTRRACLKLAF